MLEMIAQSKRETSALPFGGETRPTVALHERAENRLLAYALAAAAAGVAVLATTQPALADIIFTRTNTFPSDLDLNHDGIVDFSFSFRGFTSSSPYFGSAHFLGIAGARSGNGILSLGRPLNKGSVIGLGGSFVRSVGTLAGEHGFEATSQSPVSTRIYGPWVNVNGKYLGLEFLIGGQVHFGWAQLNVDIAHEGKFPILDATLTGYAYDTVADQALTAGQGQTPEPGTLGLLALGSLGLGLWRRRKAIC